MRSIDPGEHYRLHAEICKVLTEPKRLALLDALRVGEEAVGHLAERVGISLPNASQHLAVMRAAGLVEARRDGTTIRYRLAEPAIIEACAVIDRIIERRVAARPAVGLAPEAAAAVDPTIVVHPASPASLAVPAARAGA